MYPDGRREAILSVPNYSFSWQLTYVPEKPILLPKGTVVEASGWFDNSANNPNNPDPSVEVRNGEQSWDEMMIGFFNVAFDPKIPLRELFSKPEKKAGFQRVRLTTELPNTQLIAATRVYVPAGER